MIFRLLCFEPHVGYSPTTMRFNGVPCCLFITCAAQMPAYKSTSLTELYRITNTKRETL